MCLGEMGGGEVHTNGARMLLFLFYSRVAAAEHCKSGRLPNTDNLGN